MKLTTRYQRSYLASALLVFIFASAAFYLLLHRVLLLQMDEDLEIEQREIETYSTRAGILPKNVLQVEDQIVHYEKTAALQTSSLFITKTMWNPADHKKESFRQLQFTVRVRQDWYRVSISKSLEATKELTKQIGLIALSISALLLILLFSINHFVLRKLWKPFYKTIDHLKEFGLETKQGLRLPLVTTEEFNLLNTTLTVVSDRAMKDYLLLKEFTENASHELQTPLAIVRSKIDLLIQDEALSENQSKIVQDAYQALERMTHLNQSLLELAKIEGGQYGNSIMLDLEPLLSDKLTMLEEMFQNKGIRVFGNLEAGMIRINPVLADMLLNNLITNAIRHNKKEGRIDINLRAGHLSICNTSLHLKLDKESVFNRFSKSEGFSDGTGLGLAISRQICIASGCQIDYIYKEALHCFTMKWEV